MDRQRQFGRSNCGRTACVGCRAAPKDRERSLWRMSNFERPSTYGGCALKPVTGMPIS
jgi:hypothetical protein